MENVHTPKQFNTLFQMMAAFPDEQAAINHLTALRWKDSSYCPHCGSTKVYHFSDNRSHKCGTCRKRFSIRVGTIFEDSKIELRMWFMAIWLITSHKKGISSVQLAKDVGVTQKTAWFMLHRLRHAAQTRSFNRPLADEVEADETSAGGREKNKHAWQRAGHKQGGAGEVAVLGMLEFEGELRKGITPGLSARNVQTAIRESVEEGSLLLTDEHCSFIGLGKDYIHRYLGEMTRRFNPRESGEGESVNVLLSQVEGRLTYKALIA